MYEQKPISWAKFIDMNFPKNIYKNMDTEGHFTGIVDLVRFGNIPGSIITYFTLDNGEKITVTTVGAENHKGLFNVNPGTRVNLTFRKEFRNKICLSDVKYF